jgi:hypothetical protein
MIPNPPTAETDRLIARWSIEGRHVMLTPAGNQFDPAKRGYHAVYRDNQVNHCPGCGRTHWYIGRTLAECGFCATALPLSESFHQPATPMFRSSPVHHHAHAA